MMEKYRKRPGKPTATNPAMALAVGFLVIILTGGLLLMTPMASKSGQSVGLLPALFTATSATCVTGLTVVDTYGTYTLFGQLVTLGLIQLGGLGFMLFAISVLVVMGKRITLRSRMLLRETMSMPRLSGGIRMALQFVGIALLIELGGMLLLSIRFVPMLGMAQGLYYGLYHAVSAFCNAGFDLFGAQGSLMIFHNDPLVLLTISFLIVLGGLGFTVISDLMSSRFRLRQLTLHTKVVVLSTLILLASGMLYYALAEWNNPATLGLEHAGAPEKLLNAWFQSVTPRTAGFSSFDQGKLSDASKLITTVLMLIGASPASTGGGIKTSTVAVILVILVSVVAGRRDYEVFGRRLPAAASRTVLSVLVIYLMLMLFGGVFLSLVEQGRFSMIDLLFEEASALGTVGLTALGTANLSAPSHVFLMLLMYFGRVGPLTMMLTFGSISGHPGTIHYPEEGILLG